jgi:hypothetical protein
MSRTFEFYVGIDPEQKDEFHDYVDYINEESENFKLKVIGSFDDPESYFTYIVKGNWDLYRMFSNKSRSKDFSWIKSLYHYEDDVY